MSNHISPNRRRSISVLNQGASRSSFHHQRRRAYSIAPGEKLSPAAKTRRIIMPRKSILKAPPNSSQDSTETSAAAADDATQSMDFTEVHHPQPRKSLGRRVSFASHAHVRLFEIRDQNTSGSAEASSSPEGSTGVAGGSNDENTHSQAEDVPRTRRRSSQHRRRSSVAFSEFGEQSMDMDLDDTAPMPEQFLNGGQDDGEMEPEDEFDGEWDDGDDMDMTEAVPYNILQRRSLSLGPRQSFIPRRRRSSTAPLFTSSQSHRENQPPQYPNHDPTDDTQTSQQDQDLTSSSVHSQSFTSEGTSGEDTQPMEFTIPINHSLRPPAEQDEVWQQLRAATHAGVVPPEPPSDDGDLELTDALNRMLKVRESIGLPPHDGPLVTPSDDIEGDSSLEDHPAEDSFTSTEDSFSREADPDDLGERTMNITTMIRSSLGSTVMEETSIYDIPPIGPNPARPTELQAQDPEPSPRPPTTVFSAPMPEPAPRPSVFSAPNQSPAPDIPPTEEQVFSAPEPIQARTPAQPPRSPSKIPVPTTVPKPFTFSFKPPSRGNVTVTPSSPLKKPNFRGTAAFAPPTTPKSPKKRPAPDDPDLIREDGPSSAKKQAIGKLSPTKKTGLGTRTGPLNVRRTSMVRRPSNYFAQRKSMGGGADVTSEKASPRKQAGGEAGHGRASLGSAPVEEQTSLYPDVSLLAQEVFKTPSRAMSPVTVTSSPAVPEDQSHCEREVFRQAIVAPSPTRGSPSPANRLPSPAPAVRRTASPLPPTEPIKRTSREPTPSVRPSGSAQNRANLTVPARRSPASLPSDTQNEDEDTTGKLQPTPTQQWRDGVEGDGLEDEGPPISIEQFFEMTGIRFMEEITAPRRSMVHPSQLRPSRRRSLNASQTDEADDVPLAEFVAAMAIDLPQLELYSTVASELTAWIDESRKICKQADEEAVNVTPGLFREFADVDETEREFLLHQLKLIKANNHGTAKSQWYDWKKEWVEQLTVTAETSFTELESDAKMLENVIEKAQRMLPALREEYAQVMEALEKEQADIAEIEASDKDYLNELKATIAEQDTEIEAYRADVSEANAKLERLEEKLAEVESQKQEAANAISQAERIIHVQKESTSAEVFRLKDELEALQALHLWRITKLTADIVQLNYASRYQITIPCSNFLPNVSKLEIRRTKESLQRERDQFLHFTQLMIDGGRQFVQAQASPKGLNIQEIVQCLGNFWASCAQLRTQLVFLAIKYPLAVEVVPVEDNFLPSLKTTATVLFPAVKSKARISFILDGQTYPTWPMSIGRLKTEVHVAYGSIKRDSILDAVLGRLAQASPVANHGCLLDACIEATEQLDRI